jgi:hypothetical protein
MTRLVNISTGERTILGASVKGFSKKHGLSPQAVSELLNGRANVYRFWALENNMAAANLSTAVEGSKPSVEALLKPDLCSNINWASLRSFPQPRRF